MQQKRTFWNCIENVIYTALNFFYRLWGKELSNNTFLVFMQFVKFGIVGFSNTIISYILYLGGLILLQKFRLFENVDYLLAQLVAFAISVLWSFYWNNRFVFVIQNEEKRSLWKALLKTYISYSFTGLFLNSILLIFWVQIVHISEFIAPIINLLITVPINFIMNKLWAFKQNEKRK